jgi:hypothetical protein
MVAAKAADDGQSAGSCRADTGMEGVDPICRDI